MTAFLDAINQVGPTIQDIKQLADDTINKGILAIDELVDFIGTLNSDPITVSLPVPPPISGTYNIPPVPLPPNINLLVPNIPTAQASGTIRDIDLSNIPFPVFTAVEPTTIDPGRPTLRNVQFTAVEPVIDTSFTFPAQPDTTLPDAPVFRPINIPLSPIVTIPAFDQPLPNASGIFPPNLTFNWSESPYSSQLLTALKNELLNRITNGGTGLNPVVEQAIFDRGKDRERKELVSVQEEILKAQTARGWSRPTGSTFAALETALQQSQDKIADLSREIMIKQADLEQRNIEFALQTTLALEQSLIQENNAIMERAFRARQLIQQFTIDIFNAQIAKLNIELETYRAFSTGYELQLRGELAKIEIFKTQIEAQGLISQINQDDLQLYLGRIQALRVEADIFNTIVSSINARLNAEGQKVALFREQVNSYTAQNQAEQIKLNLYAQDIQSETLRYGLFQAKVQAFASRVEAYAKQVDAKSAVTTADIAVEDQKLRRYLGILDAIIKEVQARSEAFRANVDVYTGQTRIFESQVNAETARLGVEQKQLENNIRHSEVVGNIAVENARLAITSLVQTATLMKDSLEKAAELYIQIGASALSAINVGTSLSGQAQDSFVQEFITQL